MTYFFESGFYYYVLSEEKSEVMIGNKTAAHNAVDECPRELVIPSFVVHNSKTYTVVEIGSRAFCNCIIKTVFIPKTIRVIRFHSFNAAYSSIIKIEHGSVLEEIEEYGLGWLDINKLVIPSTVKKLAPNSLRALNKLKDVYYCGTYDFNVNGIFTLISHNINIHVSKYYPSNYFSNLTVTDHYLNCDVDDICHTKYHTKTHLNFEALIVVLII